MSCSPWSRGSGTKFLNLRGWGVCVCVSNEWKKCQNSGETPNICTFSVKFLNRITHFTIKLTKRDTQWFFSGGHRLRQKIKPGDKICIAISHKTIFKFFDSRWRIFIARSGYQPGCEIWNLLPKIGIQKVSSYFCMSHVTTQVYTSFWCNFSHVWATFSHILTHVLCFVGRLKSSKLLTTQ